MKDGKSNDSQFSFLLLLAVPLAVLAILSKFAVSLSSFYSVHKTQVLFTGMASGSLLLLILLAWLYNKVIRVVYSDDEKEGKSSSEILVGLTKGKAEPVMIDEETRTYHTQVIGSTGSGKTEGIVLPWLFDDIEKGRGALIVDGKPEEKFLKRLYGKIVEAGRADDFLLFSLAKPNQSYSFNPLAYGDPSEVAERVFASFSSDNSYYGSLQYSGLITVLKLIRQAGRIPKPGLVRELLKNKSSLSAWSKTVDDPNLYGELDPLLTLPPSEYQKNFSGLLAYFENFTKSGVANLLNQDQSEINFEDILLTKKIVYFQLPTLSTPTLAGILGKLAIQSFAHAVGKLQGSGVLEQSRLFSVYLDDFNDYIYKEFGSVASKVRSGGVGIVFSHQSLADLNKVSPEFKDIIYENTNNKIILKINDPESADFMARGIGTDKTEKTTERRSKGLLFSRDTGEQSVREVEEYVVHPNVFKSELQALDAVAVIQKPREKKRIFRIRCQPVGSSKAMLPPNRMHPGVHFVSEAKMFGSVIADQAANDTQAPSPHRQNLGASNPSSQKPPIPTRTIQIGGIENEKQTEGTDFNGGDRSRIDGL